MWQDLRNSKVRSLRAFTLIELLVSMAITTVLILMLLSLISASTESYTRTLKSINAVSQARAFMLFFSREISSQLPGTSFLHEYSEAYVTPEDSDQLAFTRVLSVDEQAVDDPGDLGTSFYYVEFSSDIGGAVSPKLFRQKIGPAATQLLLGSSAGAAFPLVDPAAREPVVYNILKFTAQPQFVNASGMLEEWDLQNQAHPRPSAMRMVIRFLDETSAQGLRTRSEWSEIARKAEDFANGNSSNTADGRLESVRTFSQTIPLAR